MRTALTSSTDSRQSKSSAARNVLAPVLEFLRQHAPFDRMGNGHLEFLAKHLKLGFYARGEVITEPARGAASRFYIIKQGRVRGETRDEQKPAVAPAGPSARDIRTSYPSEEGAWELVVGECFPVGALLTRQPVHTVHRAVEDTFCFEIDREDFERLPALSTVFHDFCLQRNRQHGCKARIS